MHACMQSLDNAQHLVYSISMRAGPTLNTGQNDRDLLQAPELPWNSHKKAVVPVADNCYTSSRTRGSG